MRESRRCTEICHIGERVYHIYYYSVFSGNGERVLTTNIGIEQKR